MATYIPGNSLYAILKKILINQAGLETYVPGESVPSIAKKILINQVKGSGPPAPAVDLCDADPLPLGTAAPGVSELASRCDHVHPSEFSAGAWEPAFSFTNPGNLSVAYSFQFGTWMRIGNWVFLRYTMVFTPTYTTASGGNRITGFPFSFDNASYFTQPIFDTITYPAGRPQSLIQGLNGTTQARVGSQGEGASFVEWSTTQFPNGTSRNLQSSLVYLAAPL